MTEHVHEWIRVDVVLPEKEGMYLAYHYYMDMVVVAFWNGESWDKRYNITHWMQLPEKPKDWSSVGLATGNLIKLENSEL